MNTRIKDLTNEKFNILIAIKYLYSNKNNKAVWLCKCDCGNLTEVVGSSLTSGNTTSCGCLDIKRRKNNRFGRRIGYGEGSFNYLYDVYKRSANKRGHTFGLTKEQFKELTRGNCVYCGVEPKQIVKVKTCIGSYIYNGIDRIDSNKGYILDNCVPCCRKCNNNKNGTTIDIMIKTLQLLGYKVTK